MARLRGTKWQGDALHGNKRLRRSFKTRAEAEAWEAEVQRRDAIGAPLSSGPSGNVNVHTIGGFIEEQFDFLWGDKKSKAHPKTYLDNIAAILGPDTPLDQIDYHSVTKIVSELKREGNANSTINKKMYTFGKLMRHANQLGVAGVLPKMPRYREPAGRMRFLSPHEERQVFDRFMHLGLPEAAHFTKFLIYTGARRGEAHDLEWTAVDRGTNMVTFWKTKTDNPRSIPITPPVDAALKWCRENNGSTGKVWSMEYQTYTDWWNRVRADLGFLDDPQFIPHTLRHTCASRLVQAGVDLRRVQTWMGHKAIQTTLRYAHLAPDDLKVAAAALSAA